MNATQLNQLPWFQDCLDQMDQALSGPAQTGFPVGVNLGNQRYRFDIWQGEQLPDRLLAYDTETAAIEANEIPQLALGVVHGDQGSCYFIHSNDVPRFIEQHTEAFWCCHNAAFDFWVTEQALKGHPTALSAWWELAGDSRLCCTMLLDCLIRLGRDDTEPINRDLGTVAQDYAGLSLNKSDPYRLRYGELIGLSAEAWTETEVGFWTYAAGDVIATLQVAKRQFQIVQELIGPYRGQLLPDALRRFGPLTACLQVQGAIALDCLSRTGINVDLNQSRALQDEITQTMETEVLELERLLPGAFKRYGSRSKKAGQVMYTDAGVPRRNAKLIKSRLENIAKSSSEPLRPARLKDGSCTDAVRYWSQHQDLDPLIGAYVKYSQQAKLAQFFKQLSQPRIYPRYRPLVRTGRTSCSDPNLQQLPRDSRFREMIVAPPGYWLLQIDYSVLELRTLAQICLRRFGRSVLAELFRQGVDPHRYTAALLLGKSPDQFNQLPLDEQKKFRQQSKAVNFGVPGGLGAESLVEYAKHSYRQEMTIDEARSFRKRLITEVYPELTPYLADRQYADMAANLQTTEARVRQALPRRKQISTASRIVSGCEETADGEPYGAELINYVWSGLVQLNQNPELLHELTTRKPSVTLMRKIFSGNTVTISGRLRGHVGFSQATNTPFQGLAADGNKLAMFGLLRAGFRVCGFIHDELLVLIPDGADYTAAVRQAQHMMADAMQQFCPDIPFVTEYLLADRWYKGLDDQPTDESGRIVPYKNNCLANHR